MRRRFIVGPNFVGISPSKAEEGDLICVVVGQLLPFVLHHKDHYYEYVGDAYVQGYTNGEAIGEL